jgi:hypothetical protein
MIFPVLGMHVYVCALNDKLHIIVFLPIMSVETFFTAFFLCQLMWYGRLLHVFTKLFGSHGDLIVASGRMRVKVTWLKSYLYNMSFVVANEVIYHTSSSGSHFWEYDLFWDYYWVQDFGIWRCVVRCGRTCCLHPLCRRLFSSRWRRQIPSKCSYLSARLNVMTSKKYCNLRVHRVEALKFRNGGLKHVNRDCII